MVRKKKDIKEVREMRKTRIVLILGVFFILGSLILINSSFAASLTSMYGSRFLPPAMRLKSQAVEEEDTGKPADENSSDENQPADDNQPSDDNNQNNTTDNNSDNPDDAQNGAIDEVPVDYNPQDGTLTYVDPNTGESRTVNIEDIGLSKEWLDALMKNGSDLAAKLNEDGSLKLLIGYDGAKKWEYDPSARLAAHYEGEKGEERVTVVTSDEKATSEDGENLDYIWASPNVDDPGAGPDGHLVVQRFNYNSDGTLSQVEYFTWTGGDRAEGGEKARYAYRIDTISGDEVTSKYLNDPFPSKWDPVKEGVVVKDEYGRYWLDEDGDGVGDYLLTFRVDGFDADQDGKSGAEEANEIDWESLVGKKIAVRGHELDEQHEGGVYFNGEKKEIFEVVDIIVEGEEGYEEKKQNMEKVAQAVDAVQAGEAGPLELFDGQIPDPSQLTDEQHIPRLMEALAPLYRENIDPQVLEDIMQFAIPELEEILRRLEQEEQQRQQEEQQQDQQQEEENGDGEQAQDDDQLPPGFNPDDGAGGLGDGEDLNGNGIPDDLEQLVQ